MNSTQTIKIAQWRGVSSVIIAALILLLLGPSWAFAQQYTISPPPFLLAQNNSGAIINNACVWTYTAGTSSAVATYSDNTGTLNSNPIRSDSAGRFSAFLAPGNSYKFVYESACTPPAHGAVLRTADGIGAMPPSGVNVDVTGTAGEALSAGDIAYLSDGSNSKAAGQWFKADADFTYASTTPEVGIVVTAIASGGTGSFRTNGRMTGLTGLTAGTAYYVSATAGALTSTAPSNSRKVGQADTTTTLVLGQTPATVVSPLIGEGRLTGTSGTCVTTADVTGVGTIFYTPCIGNAIALYDGTTWNVRTFAEITLTLTCTASKPYDVFAYDNAGVVTLETLVWTNDTTRATAVVKQNGVWVKSGATTRRLVGGFYCNSSGNQTDDTLTKRNICNATLAVQKRRPMRRLENSGDYTYSTATIRQANASALNQLEVMACVPEMQFEATVQTMARNDGAGNAFNICIGEDSTTTCSTNATYNLGQSQVAARLQLLLSRISVYPTAGRHLFTWLETGDGTITTTWVLVSAGSRQAGMEGSFEN